MVERSSNVLVPREASGKAVEQYPPITNEQVPIWAVELYYRLIAKLEGMEALVSGSRSKSVNIQQEMPQPVDGNMSTIGKQNTRYNRMNRGVKTVCHEMYAQYIQIILQSQIFTANVKGGIAVIAAEASQDSENLKDAFNTQIASNNNSWARIATVLRERQDAANALATRLEAHRLKMEENRWNAERAMGRVQNTQCIEIEDIKKKVEEDSKKEHSELASTTREMKANQK